MAKLLEFAEHHWVLVAIFIGLIIVFFYIEHLRSGKKISPQLLGAFLKQHNGILLDIRDKKDYNEGHILGSRHIPYAQLKDQLDEFKNASVPVVIVCKLGQTAGAAAQMIGKDHVYRLDGGILGWQSAGLPLVKGDKATSGKK